MPRFAAGDCSIRVANLRVCVTDRMLDVRNSVAGSRDRKQRPNGSKGGFYLTPKVGNALLTISARGCIVIVFHCGGLCE